MIEVVVALLMIVDHEIKKHRIQPKDIEAYFEKETGLTI